jgi:hypothetical protein
MKLVLPFFLLFGNISIDKKHSPRGAWQCVGIYPLLKLGVCCVGKHIHFDTGYAYSFVENIGFDTRLYANLLIARWFLQTAVSFLL